MDVKDIIQNIEGMTEFWDEIVAKNEEVLAETCIKVYEEAYRRGYKAGLKNGQTLKPAKQQEDA